MRARSVVLALAMLLALLGAPAPRTYAAASIQVDPTANDVVDANDGKCSLWEALQAISQGSTYNNCSLPGGASEPFSITFKSVGTVKVNSGTLPYVNKNVTITGPAIIEGNGNDTTMVVASSGILSLANLTFRKGNPAIMSQGGSAIINIAGCSFIDNKNDGDGGAISSTGRLNIAGSVFTANSSDGTTGGGAIWASGYDTLAIAGTVFTGNVAKRSGGAIYATAPAALIDVIFNGNIANATDPNNDGVDNGNDDYDGTGGGAVFSRNDSGNGRKMTITRGIFNGNITGQGHGGALFNNSGATVEIEDSSFNGNLAGKPPSTERRGGAIANLGGVLRMTRSMLLNNAVVGDGGGLANDRGADAILSNVTITANAATSEGAGIYNVNTQQGSPIRPKLTLLNVTLDLNAAQTAGGGIFAQAPAVQGVQVAWLTNTIVSGSDAAGGNCAGGGVESQGHNLDSGASCGFSQPGDRSSADAKLEGPFFNGGPLSSLLSQKIKAGSAAADAGDDAVCAADPVGGVDTRGASRPKGASCDIGAFEADPPVSGFGSSPVKPGPVSFGNVQFGDSQDASVSVFNTGDATLQLSAPSLSGPYAADFQVLTPFPMSVNDPTPLALRCAPTGSTPGARFATLAFSTNDPANATVSFSLTCNATAQPVAGFGSTPAAPGPVDFGNVVVGQTKNAAISFFESGTATLTVNNAVIGGANPGDFSVGGGYNFTLADNAAPVNGAVSCTPTQPGVRSATLTVSTNDPTRPTVQYNLVCTGKVLPNPPIALTSQWVTVAPTNAARGPYALALSPDGRHLYATDDGDDLVSAFSRSDTTGGLSFIDEYQDEFTGGANLNNPEDIAVSANGANVYVTGRADGGITVFQRNSDTGALQLLASPATTVKEGDSYGCPFNCTTLNGLDGAYGIALSADGKHAYVSGVVDNSVVALRRNADGGLKSFNGLGYNVNYADKTTDSLSNPFGIALSPDGGHLYVASYGNSSVVIFKRNATDGTLTKVGSVDTATVPDLVNPIRIALSPDGNNVYVAAFAGDSVVAFRRNAADGSLTKIGVSKQGQDGVSGLDGATWVTVSADGLWLFATGFNSDTVAVFARDPESGELTFAQRIDRGQLGVPPLDGARAVVASPDGRSVYVAGHEDDKVAILSFANPKPALESLSPASATAGSAVITLAVNGSGFVPGSVVRWNNASQPTTFVHGGKLTASISAPLLASVGTASVTVVNPAPGGGTSNALTFTITAPATPTEPAANPVPSIDELVPAGAPAGGPALTLTIKGASFLQSSVVRWNGQDRLTTYISPTTLQVQVAPSDMAQPGDAVVTVFNPAPGGGGSNAAAFSIAAPGENPVPAIAVLSPAYATAGASGELEVTIVGSGFVEGAHAEWDGEPRPTTFVSPTEVRMAVNAADLVSVGSASVTVVNPGPGGGPSNEVGFKVGSPTENPLPSLSRVASTTLNPDGTATLVLEGSGFIAGTKARWNGQDRPTALVSPTRVAVMVTALDFGGGTATLTVTNGAPGGGTSEELLFVLTRLRFPLVRR